MNRRTVLAAVGTASLFGTSGCLNELGTVTDGLVNPDGCPQDVDWDGAHTRPTADVDSDSIAGQFGCANADRPQPSGDICDTFEIDGETYRTVDIEPYPDPPATFDESSITAFVHDYERAYTRNRLLATYGSELVDAPVDIDEDSPLVKLTDGNATVYSSAIFDLKWVGADGGAIGGTDTAPYIVVYGVDETGVARTEANSAHQLDEETIDAMPDPVEEGTLLECF